MASLQSMQKLFDAAKPFAPTVPQSLFPYLAFILLVGAFVLTGIFSIIPPKTSIAQELVTGAAASALAGFGVIFLFLSVGIYV